MDGLISSYSNVAIGIIALFSLGLSCFALYRTYQNERPYANLSLRKVSDTLFVATLTIKNPARFDIRVEKLVPDAREFRWDPLRYETLPSGGKALDFNVEPKTWAGSIPNGPIKVRAQSHEEVLFLLYQPMDSRRKTGSMKAFYVTVEQYPKARFVKAGAATKTARIS